MSKFSAEWLWELAFRLIGQQQVILLPRPPQDDDAESANHVAIEIIGHQFAATLPKHIKLLPLHSLTGIPTTPGTGCYYVFQVEFLGITGYVVIDVQVKDGILRLVTSNRYIRIYLEESTFSTWTTNNYELKDPASVPLIMARLDELFKWVRLRILKQWLMNQAYELFAEELRRKNNEKPK